MIPTRRLRLVILAGIAALLAGCASTPTGSPADTAPSELDSLITAMTGTFSSSAQAQRDPAFRHVVLHMVPMPHLDRRDPEARWLYVEQAMAEAPERPYRQRAYRVRMIDGEAPDAESAVFEFAGDPLRLAGAWNDPRRLARIRIDDLQLREGCEVILLARFGGRDGMLWEGSTLGDRCASTLMGATYAQSEVQIYADRIHTWDRGYDANGKQVWGSVNGPYEFRRE